MMNEIKSPRFLILCLLVVLAACTRAIPYLIPHTWNLTAVGALAIFAGAQFKNKFFALFLPLAAMGLSDLFIGHGFSMLVYIGFTAMVLCGMAINKNKSVANIGLASIAGATVFYLLTNFAFFYPETLYPHNFSGIIASYIAALPFYRNMLIGDAVYGLVLFGSFYYIQKQYPTIAVN